MLGALPLYHVCILRSSHARIDRRQLTLLSIAQFGTLQTDVGPSLSGMGLRIANKQASKEIRTRGLYLTRGSLVLPENRARADAAAEHAPDTPSAALTADLAGLSIAARQRPVPTPTRRSSRQRMRSVSSSGSTNESLAAPQRLFAFDHPRVIKSTLGKDGSWGVR
jgi:hypothetical protein